MSSTYLKSPQHLKPLVYMFLQENLLQPVIDNSTASYMYTHIILNVSPCICFRNPITFLQHMMPIFFTSIKKAHAIPFATTKIIKTSMQIDKRLSIIAEYNQEGEKKNLKIKKKYPLRPWALNFLWDCYHDRCCGSKEAKPTRLHES